MLVLHGIVKSRAFRVMCAAAEMGVALERRDMGFGPGASQSPEFRKINPFGAVPALSDGDFNLAETAAIILYLAKNHAKGWYPSDPKAEARVWQWAFFAYTDLERPQIQVSQHTAMLPEDKRIPAVAEAGRTALARVYSFLDATLASQPYLSGDRLGLADLLVGTVAFTALLMKFDLSPYPHFKAWLEGLAARPAIAECIKQRG